MSAILFSPAEKSLMVSRMERIENVEQAVIDANENCVKVLPYSIGLRDLDETAAVVQVILQCGGYEYDEPYVDSVGDGVWLVWSINGRITNLWQSN